MQFSKIISKFLRFTKFNSRFNKVLYFVLFSLKNNTIKKKLSSNEKIYPIECLKIASIWNNQITKLNFEI